MSSEFPGGQQPPAPPPTPPPAAPPPPPPYGGTPPGGTTSSNRNLMIVLAYLWILCLVPLLVEKEDREVQWHAKHGVVLLVVEIIAWIAVNIIAMVLGAVTAGLGCLAGLLMPLIMVAFLVIRVMAIVKGVNGQRFLIPGISEFADRF